MELLKDLLVEIFAREEIKVIFPNLKMDTAELIEMKCYKALQIIKTTIDNDNLDDFECIEEIVNIFEEIGCKSESRHDFG